MIDADMIVLRNIDHLFNAATGSAGKLHCPEKAATSIFLFETPLIL
jgi:alpha-N-acetylglucosamine transferase